MLNKIALSRGRPQIGFLGNELQSSAILFGDTRVLDVIVLTEPNKKKRGGETRLWRTKHDDLRR